MTSHHKLACPSGQLRSYPCSFSEKNKGGVKQTSIDTSTDGTKRIKDRSVVLI